MPTTIEQFVKTLDHLTEEAVKPLVAKMIEAIEKEIEQQKPDPLNPIQQQLDKFRAGKQELEKQLIKGFSDQHARHLVIKGIELILKEIKNIRGGEHIYKELLAGGEKFTHDVRNKEFGLFEEVEENTLPRSFYQQVLNLSDSSIDHLCTYAIERYLAHQELHEMANNQALFFVLTELNPYLFQPWVFYGVCCLKQEFYQEALRSFAMASIVHFDAFLPHLYTAHTYYLLHDKHLAEKTLTLALSLASEEEKNEYKDMIDYLKMHV